MHTYIRRQPTIGVIPGWQAYTGTLDSFLEHVLRGIQTAAHDRGCSLLLACGLGPPYGIDFGRPAWPVISPEVDFIPVGPWNTDGLIVIPPLACETAYFRDLIASGFPLIYAGDRETGPSVIVDNEGGIRQAVAHLVGHGHRRIAFVAGRDILIEGDSRIRIRAFKAALQEWGLEFTPDLVAHGHHTYAGGCQAVRQILGTGAPFTALLASNDQSALGAMDELRQAGRSVPQDVAVIGFDDRLEGRAYVPQLTSVHFPMFELGYQAVGFLLERIQGWMKGDEIVRIPTRLVIRGSCGCQLGGKVEPEVERVWDTISKPAELQTTLGSEIFRDEADEALVGTQMIARAMTEAAYNETQRLSMREVAYLSQSLVEAFRSSLARGNPRTFQVAIQQILERVASQGDDLYGWQQAVSILRERGLSLPEVSGTRLSHQQVEDMLHQARLAISEVSRGQFSRSFVYQDAVADQIGQMTSQFIEARDEAGVYASLQTSLPVIGIEHAAVALFEPDGDDLVAGSVLQTPPLAGELQPQFPSRSFPPPGLYPEDRPFNLALLPLVVQEGISGYVAFEAVNLTVCAAVVRQLAAALRGVRLYHAAVEAQRLAEEASRLKSRFLSMVSHELRTPLNLISGLSHMLLQESQETGQQEGSLNRKDLERIYISAQHLDGLIRDVLDLARIDVGQLHLDRKLLDLHEVLEPVMAIGEQLASDKDLVWRAEVAADLPEVVGDRTRLRQVLLNLVHNAIKFTARGEVLLTAVHEDGWVKIAVSDTGLGIPLNEQEVIFDEFRQSERSSARGYGGLGLGLAICKRLVEMHGGEIQVCSSGEEGGGSTFSFTLPTVECRPEHDKGEVFPAAVGRISLLVKDLANSEVLKVHLEQRGYEVLVYQVGEAADSWLGLSLAPPDAVVLDLGLTSERGWEILRMLKENPATQNVPVLFSAVQGDENRGSLLEVDYLTKPVGEAALSQALTNLNLPSKGSSQGIAPAILVVDDDPEVLNLHARLVEKQLPEYQVMLARDGRQALRMIQQAPPALVMLDLMMPELDGFGVLEAMREQEISRNIPVVVVTGQALTEEDMARLSNGVAGVLAKGMFSLDETLRRLTDALRRKRRPGSEAGRAVMRALAYIHAHYAEAISRGDIARYVGLSERHLTRCFHQEVGVTPITYLNRYRVKQARSLLEGGSMGITEVAMEVGFSTSGYFTRVFRDEVGVSPRAYLQSGCPKPENL